MEQLGAHMIVANDIRKVKDDETEALLIPSRGGHHAFRGSRSDLARRILDEVAREAGGGGE